MHFRKITIVGVGLLGGSIGLAARERRVAGEIAGYVRRATSLKECERAGAVDYATTDLLAAVSDSDLIILCTPLAQMSTLVRQFLPALKRGAIVTDVGSVKADVVRPLDSLLKKTGAHFVGSHPMAGGEKMGVLAARANLFVNANCVVTPSKNSSPAAVRRVEKFWQALGAKTLRLSAEQHDLVVSRSSHLPHVVAATLASLVLDAKQPSAQVKLCATGFRDTTRIASGSPEMWRDIVLSNQKNVSQSVDQFVTELKKFQAALKKNDAVAVEKFFTKAKARRDNWFAKVAATTSE